MVCKIYKVIPLDKYNELKLEGILNKINTVKPLKKQKNKILCSEPKKTQKVLR